ncbi:hypothetical protein [Nocardioides daeguensis]|uniref:Uncharacterized protein n=1 Tax=Nocardioides daeguensis TaxID=908359 RepID=A0ABP6V725_9ACTN|nr:hypothetical protein [Nocardioides daeguensis]MBV6726249.1 hypothetical protein [Nocardioides daeguensis]MCR1772092.1 hypothetical protein [Nocardioides daeguensis]
MGSKDEFGPDTESIRAWLDKRSSYARDARVVGTRADAAPAAAPGPSAPPGPAPGTTTADRADSLRAGRSVLEALGVESPPDPPSRIARAGGLDSTDLGRSVVEALRADMPKKPAPAPRPASPAPTPDPAPVEVEAAAAPVRPAPPPRVRSAPEVKHGRWTEPEDNLTALNASTDAQFPVRGGIRRALSWMLLAVLAGTGAASYAALRNPTATTLGIAATLGFLMLVVWAVRAGCTTTELAVRRGQLSIKRNGQTELVDLASTYTPIAIVGEPSDRRWTVLIERPGLPLVVITRSMVDPHWFTTVLYRLRPGLRPDAPAAEQTAEPVTQP